MVAVILAMSGTFRLVGKSTLRESVLDAGRGTALEDNRAVASRPRQERILRERKESRRLTGDRVVFSPEDAQRKYRIG